MSGRFTGRRRPATGTGSTCRKYMRCPVCDDFDRDARSERKELVQILAQDREFVARLRRLADLFYDAGQAPSRALD